MRTLLAAVAGFASFLAGMPRVSAGCGELLIVYDRSGSMAHCKLGGVAKEAIAKKAINAMVSEFPGMAMGLMVFPDTLSGVCDNDEAACRKGRVVVPVAADGGPKVASFLDGMRTSCGGTPTGDTMQIAKTYDQWVDKAQTHFVLLITDGQPTCQDGDNGGKPDPMDDTCSKGMPGVACDGGGRCECANPTKVFDAISELYGRAIRTFVVGFEGMGDAGCTDGRPFNPDTLNKMAELGGEPSGGATKYYSATNEATLKDALRRIAGKVGGGTVAGCIPDSGKGGSGGGGSGGAGGGTGGSGAGGGAAGQGGSGEDPTPPGPGRNPGCLCVTAGAPGGFPNLVLAAPFVLIWLRRRARASGRASGRRF